jgi:hypothetical protein
MTPEEERAAALAAYQHARDEFDAAQDQWERHLDASEVVALDPTAAEASFDRFQAANQGRDDALDLLWVAWRNRPNPA